MHKWIQKWIDMNTDTNVWMGFLIGIQMIRFMNELMVNSMNGWMHSTRMNQWMSAQWKLVNVECVNDQK